MARASVRAGNAAARRVDKEQGGGGSDKADTPDILHSILRFLYEQCKMEHHDLLTCPTAVWPLAGAEARCAPLRLSAGHGSIPRKARSGLLYVMLTICRA